MSRTWTCWAELMAGAMKDRGETLADIVSTTLSEFEMNDRFDSGYGGHNGVPFTAWTANTVYFPVVYDGAEWVGSVARNPDGKPTDHQGGE